MLPCLFTQPCRQRLTPEGQHHARSMMAVGVAATLYHATSGTARRWARKVDYWTIAYTSSAMVRLQSCVTVACPCHTCKVQHGQAVWVGRGSTAACGSSHAAGRG